MSRDPGRDALRPLRGEASDHDALLALVGDARVVAIRPDTERASHYFRARLSAQFDAVIHLDETRAAEPLERTAEWERGEVPETYPFAV